MTTITSTAEWISKGHQAEEALNWIADYYVEYGTSVRSKDLDAYKKNARQLVDALTTMEDALNETSPSSVSNGAPSMTAKLEQLQKEVASLQQQLRLARLPPRISDGPMTAAAPSVRERTATFAPLRLLAGWAKLVVASSLSLISMARGTSTRFSGSASGGRVNYRHTSRIDTGIPAKDRSEFDSAEQAEADNDEPRSWQDAQPLQLETINHARDDTSRLPRSTEGGPRTQAPSKPKRGRPRKVADASQSRPDANLGEPTIARKRKATTQQQPPRLTTKRRKVVIEISDDDDEPLLPWAIEDVRGEDFEADPIPAIIWEKVREQMESFDNSGRPWMAATAQNGAPTCAAAYCRKNTRPAEWKEEDSELHTCKRCRKEKAVCVAIQYGRMNILCIRDGVYIEE